MDDRLWPELLARPGAALGHTVIVKPVTDSTNDDAKALADQGAGHGLVVLAERQEKGRGRLGRTWRSPAGCNLLFSVILRPLPVQAQAGLITLAAGVALAEAVIALGKLPARITIAVACRDHPLTRMGQALQDAPQRLSQRAQARGGCGILQVEPHHFAGDAQPFRGAVRGGIQHAPRRRLAHLRSP